MSYKSIEKEYYKKQYGEGCIEEGGYNPSKIRADFFASGKRYHLVEEVVHGLKHRDVLLELGCNHGAALSYMAREFNFSRSVGIDIIFDDEVFLDSSKSISIKPANLNENFPFDDGSIDLLVAMMIFEHLFDPFHSFSEVARLLSSDGIAVINLPLVTGMKNRLRLLSGSIPITSVPYERWSFDKQWDGNHLHNFSIKSIMDLCSICNLKILDMKAVGSFVNLKNLRPSIFASEITFAVAKIEKH